MKTVMQELIDDIIEQGLDKNDIISIKDELLEKEKQMIVDAWKDGNHSEMRGGKYLEPLAEQYFKDTYNERHNNI